MSPASRSKSKDKKASKETQKVAAKPTGFCIAVDGVPASIYNPLMRQMSILSTLWLLVLSMMLFQTMVVALSNVHKEKSSKGLVQSESVPGADNDKQEKIRQKNERKHQRQEDRRAQELHERCIGHLMSRKLETFSQQLIVMGFSYERATMALISNEGRVEESVEWLF